MHDLASLLVNVLMALTTATHRECRVHVHVVTGKVQTDQQLEHHAPTGLCSRQKDQQACCRASISYHVEHCAKFG